jgi:hypothetical protein
MAKVSTNGEAQGIDIVASKSRTFHVRGKIPGFGPADRYTRVQLEAVEMGCESKLVRRGAEQAPDARGNFDFGGVTPGPHLLSAMLTNKGNLNRAERLIRVVDADVDGVTLVPSPGFELHGRLRPEGDKRIDAS